MLYIVLLVVFLLLMGAVISSTFAERMPRADRPQIYWDDSFVQIINLLLIPMLILFVILMILNWKTTLIITLIGVIGGKILKIISEPVIVLPLYKLLYRKREDEPEEEEEEEEEGGEEEKKEKEKEKEKEQLKKQEEIRMDKIEKALKERVEEMDKEEKNLRGGSNEEVN